MTNERKAFLNDKLKNCIDKGKYFTIITPSEAFYIIELMLDERVRKAKEKNG